MPVAQWFCWQMGLTATLHTLGMILIFMPIMAIDARRVKVLSILGLEFFDNHLFFWFFPIFMYLNL